MSKSYHVVEGESFYSPEDRQNALQMLFTYHEVVALMGVLLGYVAKEQKQDEYVLNQTREVIAKILAALPEEVQKSFIEMAQQAFGIKIEIKSYQQVKA